MACGTRKYVWMPELLLQTNNADQKQSLCINCVFHELMELGSYTIPYFHEHRNMHDWMPELTSWGNIFTTLASELSSKGICF